MWKRTVLLCKSVTDSHLKRHLDYVEWGVGFLFGLLTFWPFHLSSRGLSFEGCQQSLQSCQQAQYTKSRRELAIERQRQHRKDTSTFSTYGTVQYGRYV